MRLPRMPPCALIRRKYACIAWSTGICDATVGPLLSPTQPILIVPAVAFGRDCATAATRSATASTLVTLMRTLLRT